MSCNMCKTTLYFKTKQYARPNSAPVTHIQELEQELLNLTGDIYIPVPRHYCPNCGEPLTGPRALTLDWIKCSEKLPEIEEDVCCYTIEKQIGKGYLCDYEGKPEWFVKYEDSRWDTDRHLEFVSHWMPLPEPPKKVTGG